MDAEKKTSYICDSCKKGKCHECIEEEGIVKSCCCTAQALRQTKLEAYDKTLKEIDNMYHNCNNILDEDDMAQICNYIATAIEKLKEKI